MMFSSNHDSLFLQKIILQMKEKKSKKNCYRIRTLEDTSLEDAIKFLQFEFVVFGKDKRE